MTAYKASCPHGRYDKHAVRLIEARGARVLTTWCPGGTFLPADTLVILKEDGEWPRWAQRIVYDLVDDSGDESYLAGMLAVGILDALAAAQRSNI